MHGYFTEHTANGVCATASMPNLRIYCQHRVTRSTQTCIARDGSISNVSRSTNGIRSTIEAVGDEIMSKSHGCRCDPAHETNFVYSPVYLVRVVLVLIDFMRDYARQVIMLFSRYKMLD